MTPEKVRDRREWLLEVLQAENANTMKVIEAIPEDRLNWKPDNEKSWPTQQLAFHICGASKFFTTLVEGGEMGDHEPPTFTSKADLVNGSRALLDEYVGKLSEYSVEDLTREVDFMGEKHAAIRILGWHPWHMVHHRGQLTVYLRLMGATVPSTYGPSGDEDFGG